MADSQALTISYGGVQLTGQLVGGKLLITVPVSPQPDSDGPEKAIDLKIFQLLGKILPVVLMLITGGFSPAVLAAALPIIAEILGISLGDTRAVIQTSLQLEAQS